jgi:hypothetical protein
MDIGLGSPTRSCVSLAPSVLTPKKMGFDLFADRLGGFMCLVPSLGNMAERIHLTGANRAFWSCVHRYMYGA